MSKGKIVVVVPTIRPERMESFRGAWEHLFKKHDVTLITVYDGENPTVRISGEGTPYKATTPPWVCRFTDACRNLGFLHAARLNPDYVLTLDDDVKPYTYLGTTSGKSTLGEWTAVGRKTNDPIREHLDVLQQKVSLDWLPTFTRQTHDGVWCYPRGFPQKEIGQYPAMLSHGVWEGVHDYDGDTQLFLENGGDRLDGGAFYRGPIPRGVLFPLCGMNVMVRREALPYFYFAPMGPDSGVEGLHRFADIWMGVYLKREFDRLGWACYTGGAVVHHTRASDARKNVELEKLGREWNEHWGLCESGNDPSEFLPPGMYEYLESYAKKREQFRADVTRALGGGS